MTFLGLLGQPAVGQLHKIKAQIPLLRRLGRPEEIARIVYFLASDASSYIAGQVWGVNGGMDM